MKAEMQRAMVETYHVENGVPGYRMLHDLLYNKFPCSVLWSSFFVTLRPNSEEVT